jgi:Ca2+-transporting ATPase
MRARQAPSAGVVVRHADVPGRLRVDVPGLWRNPALAARLGRVTDQAPGIVRVDADPRTGRALVRHAPSVCIADVVAMLESVLAGSGGVADAPPAVAAAAPTPPRDVPGPPAATRPGAGEASLAEPPSHHAMPLQDLLASLGTDVRTGLAEPEARRRLDVLGPNRLAEPAERSALATFAAQFGSLPVALLGGSALLSASTRAFFDAAVTLGVVLVNAAIGFATETGTQRVIRQMTRAEDLDAHVLRARIERRLPASCLVPGDLVVLRRGDPVPADARLLDGHGVAADESSLTGESMPRHKRACGPLPASTPLVDRENMLFLGTTVVGGSARAVVVATGDGTEIGRVQALAQRTVAPRTPSEKDLDRLGRDVALAALGICGVAFGIGLLRGHGLLPMLKGAIALAVAAVPEGLPAVATSTLALGLRRMRGQELIVRNLTAVETLGSVHVLCLDKTGTLTQNRMRVTAAVAGTDTWTADAGVPAPETVRGVAEVAVLALESAAAADSGTERAVVEFAREVGVDVAGLAARYERAEVRERDQAHNLVAVRQRDREGAGELLAVKGRPAEVLARCDQVCEDGRCLPLDDARRRAVVTGNDRLAAGGLRVLGVAWRRTAGGVGLDDDGLVWGGLVGMCDPLRDGVAGAIARLQQAGIRTVMITGDQGATATHVAEAVGLAGDEPLRVLDAEQIESMDPAMLTALASRAHVFARVSPARKLEIVQALRRAGRVVAMTGDGINDGPALKAADLGIAMGRDGTRVARDVADLLIADDDLGHVVSGVREGRAILSNIRKAVHFLLSTNLSEIFVVLAETLGGPSELESPMELFWINLVTDVLPGRGRALEPPEADILDRPPRAPGAPLVDARYYRRLGLEAAIIGGCALAAHFLGRARHGPGPATRGITFLAIAGAQILHAISCRSDRFDQGGVRGLFANRALVGALAASSALLLLPFLLPSLRRLLGIAPLSLADAATAGVAAAGSFALNELVLALRDGAKPEDTP